MWRSLDNPGWRGKVDSFSYVEATIEALMIGGGPGDYEFVGLLDDPDVNELTCEP